MNCLPFLGQQELGGFLMSGIRASGHSIDTRRRAVELFDAGLGHRAAARVLGIPVKAVRKWGATYRSVGSGVLLSMGANHRKYSWEEKVAAAEAVVGGRLSKPQAMAEFHIASASPLDKWCKLYREGGADALKPKSKGRPKGSAEQPRELTREEELEKENRRLRAEVAYLKKSTALKAEKRSRTAPKPRS